MSSIIIMFGLLGAVLYLFMKEKLPTDLVAMSAFAAVILLGFLDAEDVAGVFSNPAPLTIGAMFVLSAALFRTGVIDSLARVFRQAAGKSRLRALAIMALIVIPASACINNTPVVVVFLPIVLSYVRDTDLKASQFLIPLSFFSILGGTMTLLGTSTNLLVNGLAVTHNQPPFGIFEISKLGVIFVIIGSTYLFLFGKFLLPNRDTLSSLISAEDTRAFYTKALIPEGSPLVGKTLLDSQFLKNKNVRIYNLWRENTRFLRRRLDEIELRAGDILICRATPQGIAAIQESNEVTFPYKEQELIESPSHAVKLVEALVPPHSDFVGKSIRQLRLREKYGVLVAALHRKGTNLRQSFEHEELAFGDTLLIEGPNEHISQLGAQDQLVFLNQSIERPMRPQKAPIAIATILGVMLSAALGFLPILSAAIVGVAVVLITGCIDTKEAYASIQWPILLLIFGMLGLGAAMENSGAARLIAAGLTDLFSHWGPHVVLAATYLLAAILTEMVTNNAVAILLTPIAIEIAQELGVDARPFIVAIMFGASASFITPIGYQTNTYVFGAGGYKFTDFSKIGVPLVLILWLTATYFIPLFWPF